MSPVCELVCDRALRDALAAAPLAPSETRQELAELAAGYLAKTFSTQNVRGEPAGRSWAMFAREQGWVALIVPEAYGGLGLGFAESATVIEQCGRLLAYPELVGTAVLATSLLSAGEDPGRYLTRLAAGELIVAVAGGFDPDGSSAVVAGDRVTGAFPAVVDAPRADLLLIPCREPSGELSLYAVDAADAAIAPVAVLDLSRSQARVVLDDAPARLVVPASRFDEVWRTARLRTTVALAAEQVGGAGHAFDLTLSYIAERQQFGRPIGSFQAVKHRCADMFVGLQSARSAVEFAVWAAETRDDCLPLAASIAKAAAGDSFSEIAAEAVQLHGGIGFTWEHDAHRYFRRARSDEVLLGDSVYHRAVIAKTLELVTGS